MFNEHIRQVKVFMEMDGELVLLIEPPSTHSPRPTVKEKLRKRDMAL